MNGCTLYTSWAETDDWGRELVWSSRPNGYYLKKLPLVGEADQKPDFKPVAQVTFALALLRAHERLAGR